MEDKIEDKAESIKEKIIEEELKPKMELTREEKETAAKLEQWNPKTKLGKLVREGKIKDIKEVIGKHKILESEIVDTLLKIESEVLLIGQAKGKFGGGKRRAWKQTQKKTMEGNVATFACLVSAGNKNGYMGVGYGRAKETLPARTKALRKAKLNIMEIERGCGSFNCACSEKHSIPFRVEGKCGSVRIILFPAPQGTGLVIGNECKKILRLAGIKDIYSDSFGQTRSTINLISACVDALNKLAEIKRK